MSKTKIYYPVILMIFGSLLGVVRGHIFGPDAEYRLELDFGYRWQINLKGSEDLYRTQVNLGEGPKLFGGTFFFVPADGDDKFFDRLELQMNNWGGEPYNTVRVRASKSGIYELNFLYQNISYFSSIPSFANPLFDSGSLESQHKHDNALRTFSLDMRFRPGKKITPFFAYQRSARRGLMRTTLAADWDEFVLESNLDLHSNDLRGGVIFHLPRFSLLLEQGARWYRDRTPFLSPEPQEGNSNKPIFGRDIFLDGYEGRRDIDTGAIPYTTASATYRPFDILSLKGRATYSMADIRSGFSETFSGNFFSFPGLRAFYSGADNRSDSRTTSPNILVDLSAELQPLEWLKVVERFRTHRFHTAGSTLSQLIFHDVDPVLQPGTIDRLELLVPFDSRMAMDLNIQELEGQFSLTPDLILRVGHRYESKNLKLEDTFPWKRNVLVLGGSYHFSSRDRIAVDYELGRTDQPIFRTDPLDFTRLRIRGRYSPFESLEINGSLRLFDHDNDVLSYTSRNRGYTLQFSYSPAVRLSFGGQWTHSDLDTEIPYVVPQDFSIETFAFRERGNYGNMFISLGLPRNSRLNLGYSVWGNSGNFPVNYHQPFAKLEIPLGERLVAYGQWNYYGYNEKLNLYPQDYRAHLAVIGFRVVLGK